MAASRTTLTAPTIVPLPDGVPRPSAACVGRIVSATHGRLEVECDGRGPRPARHVAGLADLTAARNVGREVLVLFENGDADRPIVVAWMASAEQTTVTLGPRAMGTDSELEARVDGQRVVIEAGREILLRCGKSSILLQEDGRVVIRGTDLLSRSSGINKIKGGAVRIN